MTGEEADQRVGGGKARNEVDVHLTSLSLFKRCKASCVARIWIALSVGWMCGSWPG